MDKVFSKDIESFYNKLKNKEIFSFSKFADGEWSVMKDQSLNNTEFWYDKEEDEEYKQQLLDAFQYKNDRYYVGISCPCCQGEQVFNEMKEVSGQPEDRLTWANLWVNSNYSYYLDNILPLYSDYEVVLVANKDANRETLPFKTKYFVPISNNAWKNDQIVVDVLKDVITKESLEGHLFLFCCGPFGNILCHQLTEHSDKNTYLDIGSTLNPFFGTGFRRGYFGRFKSMEGCRWG